MASPNFMKSRSTDIPLDTPFQPSTPIEPRKTLTPNPIAPLQKGETPRNREDRRSSLRVAGRRGCRSPGRLGFMWVQGLGVFGVQGLGALV